MNKEKVKIIAKELIQIINNRSNLSVQGEFKTRFFYHKGICFTLIDDDAILFESIIRRILSDGTLGEKFTEKYVEKRILDIITDVIKSDADEKKTYELSFELINELENYSTEFIVIVPIDGVKIDGYDEIEIGQVKFFEMDETKTLDYFSVIEQVLLRSKHEEKDIIIRKHRERFAELTGSVCAEYKVVAEPDRAIERAEQQTKLALQIIGFGIPLIYSDNIDIQLGLKGETIKNRRYTPVLAVDKTRCMLNDKWVRSNRYFELNRENVDCLKKSNILKLSDILRKNNLNDYELALLRSLYWFNSSFYQNDLENKFLNLITAIETLLTPRDGNPIGTAIAEGVAIILTKGVDNRKSLKKEVQRLYRLRSAVSHGGKKEILDEDFKSLREIVHSLIIEVINMDASFQSQIDLLSWIEEQKFS